MKRLAVTVFVAALALVAATSTARDGRPSRLARRLRRSRQLARPLRGPGLVAAERGRRPAAGARRRHALSADVELPPSWRRRATGSGWGTDRRGARGRDRC